PVERVQSTAPSASAATSNPTSKKATSVIAPPPRPRWLCGFYTTGGINANAAPSRIAELTHRDSGGKYLLGPRPPAPITPRRIAGGGRRGGGGAGSRGRPRSRRAKGPPAVSA